MNENKIKLILFIAQSFSDEQCANILESCIKAVSNKGEMLLANVKQWEESEHPRHDDGRFAPGGTMRPKMSKKEAQKWDTTGKMNPNPNRSEKLKSLKKEIDKLQESVNFLEDHDANDIARDKKAILVKKQREYAEAVREWKHAERLKIESGVDKRIMKRKANEYYELEDDIEFIEEKYRGDNPVGGELKFPKGKRGAKIKAQYEEKLKKRDELLSEIDWDKVDDDEINAEREAEIK